MSAAPGGANTAPSPVGAAAPSAASLAAERLLDAVAGAPVTVARDLRGLAHLVGTSPQHPLPLPAGVSRSASAPEQALAHLTRLGALFGLVDPAHELEPVPLAEGLDPAPGQDRVVRFQQILEGARVLGGELAVVLDAAGALRSVTGETLAGSVARDVDAASIVSAERAARTAVTVTARAHPGAPMGSLRAVAPQRWYLDPALIGIPPGVHMNSGPVWRTEVIGPANVRELVLVDPRTGTVPLHFDQVAHGLDQVVCDRANRPDTVATGSDCKTPYARAPGTGANGAEVDQAWDNTVRASRYYASYLGLDLTALIGDDTGDGKRLRSTVRFCPDTTLCSVSGGNLFDNAFWNGRAMYYGNGWQQADDIVVHELSHGLTDRTSRLLYLYQSGAINESMSDVFGELADLTDGFDGAGVQTRWTFGEDAPLDNFPLRNLADPTRTPIAAQPDRMTSPLYQVDLLFTDNGAVHDNSGVGNKAAYLIAEGTADPVASPGGMFNGQSITGIGLAKTSRLYLRVENMLTSGADYADLGRVLPQACSDLVGTSGFTTTDCTSVKKVVAATEMAQQPTGMASAAAAPEVGYCPSGVSDTILYDSFESFSRTRWTLGGQWNVIPDYARTGTHSVYGVEPDYLTSSSLTLNTAYPVPHGVNTYLRFAHQYRLDAGLGELAGIPIGPYYDGARLEYQISGGSWRSATGLPWENGPRRRITPQGGTPYTAFGGDSRGYQSSRVDLSSLAGKTIKLRWRVFGDKRIAVDGWTVDDVRLFACGATRPSNVSAMSYSAGRGSITIRWKQPLYAAGGITGYKVDRSGAAARRVSPKTRSYTFKNLKPGKSYTFTLNAIGKGGLGPTSTRTAKPR